VVPHPAKAPSPAKGGESATPRGAN
jgi:hypothetical protein